MTLLNSAAPVPADLVVHGLARKVAIALPSRAVPAADVDPDIEFPRGVVMQLEYAPAQQRSLVREPLLPLGRILLAECDEIAASAPEEALRPENPDFRRDPLGRGVSQPPIVSQEAAA